MINGTTRTRADLLGQRVRIIGTGDSPGIDDIVGRVCEHTRFADGSERFDVQYWHQGERRRVTCERCEIEAVE